MLDELTGSPSSFGGQSNEVVELERYSWSTRLLSALVPHPTPFKKKPASKPKSSPPTPSPCCTKRLSAVRATLTASPLPPSRKLLANDANSSNVTPSSVCSMQNQSVDEKRAPLQNTRPSSSLLDNTTTRVGTGLGEMPILIDSIACLLSRRQGRLCDGRALRAGDNRCWANFLATRVRFYFSPPLTPTAYTSSRLAPR